MTIKKILKRIIPVAFVGAAMLVLAMPVSAMAHDWDHHDNGRHLGWMHRDHDGDNCGFRGRQAFYPRNYYPAPAPQYPMPYGYGNNPRVNYMQQKWQQAEAKHQAAVASGNHRKAKETANRLYELDQQMGVNNRYAAAPYYGYGQNQYYNQNPYYNQGGSMLGNMFGLW